MDLGAFLTRIHLNTNTNTNKDDAGAAIVDDRRTSIRTGVQIGVTKSQEDNVTAFLTSAAPGPFNNALFKVPPLSLPVDVPSD